MAIDTKIQLESLFAMMEKSGAEIVVNITPSPVNDTVSTVSDDNSTIDEGMDPNEQHSDDKEDVHQTQNQFLSTAFNGLKANNNQIPNVFEFIRNIRNPKIKELSKQIDDHEKEADRIYKEEKKKITKKMTELYESDIKDIQRKIDVLKERMIHEISLGYNHIQSLENEITNHMNTISQYKQNIMFPHTNVAFCDDSAGIYVCYEDIFCEYINGLITLDILPNSYGPTINIIISSPSDDTSNPPGLSLNLIIYGLKLKGEKGKGIPSIKLEIAKFIVKLSINISVRFDIKLNKWQMNHFDIKIVTFIGPLGFGRRTLNTILKFIVNRFKKLILDSIPTVFGHYLIRSQSPIIFRSDFKITGFSLNDLKTQNSKLFQKICDISSIELAIFILMQKHTMNRSISISTIEDSCNYFRRLQRNPEIMSYVINLWIQICEIYQNEINHLDCKELNQYQTIFTRLIHGMKELQRKRIHLLVDVKEYKGDFSCSQIIRLFHEMCSQMKIDSYKSSSNQSDYRTKRHHMELDHINQLFLMMLSLYQFGSKNMDQLDFQSSFQFVSGPQAMFRVNLLKILAKCPLQVNAAIPFAQYTIPEIPKKLPFILRQQPHEDGDFSYVWENVLSSEHQTEEMRAEHETTHRRSLFQSTRYDIASELNEATKGGNNGHETIVGSMYLKKPAVKIIVDSPSFFEAGSDLFTMEINSENSSMTDLGNPSPHHRDPRDGKRPLDKYLPYDLAVYLNSVLDSIDQSKSLPSDDHSKATSNPSNNPSKSPSSSLSASSTEMPSTKGCFANIFTSPNIKIHGTLSEMKIKVQLINWLRLQTQFLENIKSYSEYMSYAGWGNFTENDLVSYLSFLKYFSKYVYQNGIKIENHLMIRLYKRANDIRIAIDTPPRGCLDDESYINPIDTSISTTTPSHAAAAIASMDLPMTLASQDTPYTTAIDLNAQTNSSNSPYSPRDRKKFDSVDSRSVSTNTTSGWSDKKSSSNRSHFFLIDCEVNVMDLITDFNSYKADRDEAIKRYLQAS